MKAQFRVCSWCLSIALEVAKSSALKPNVYFCFHDDVHFMKLCLNAGLEYVNLHARKRLSTFMFGEVRLQITRLEIMQCLH